MDEIHDWLQQHDASLVQIAEHLDLDGNLVRTAAALVLAGYVDDDIVEEIRDQVVARDSQESPVRHVPQMVFEVRRLLAEVGTHGEDAP